MSVDSIFSGVPQQLPNEVFEDIVKTKTCRIERIISQGQCSPEDFWYDQEQNEWVMLLAGRAALRLEGTDGLVELGPGDYLNIPAHKKHRVEWTDRDETTIWLAVHY